MGTVNGSHRSSKSANRVGTSSGAMRTSASPASTHAVASGAGEAIGKRRPSSSSAADGSSSTAASQNRRSSSIRPA